MPTDAVPDLKPGKTAWEGRGLIGYLAQVWRALSWGEGGVAHLAPARGGCGTLGTG